MPVGREWQAIKSELERHFQLNVARQEKRGLVKSAFVGKGRGRGPLDPLGRLRRGTDSGCGYPDSKPNVVSAAN